MTSFLDAVNPLRWIRREKRKPVREKTEWLEPFIDLEPEFWPYHDRCRPFTMTSTERIYALYKALGYVTAHEIPGHFVECGVWKGGSAMLCALTMAEESSTDRLLYLYDTFTGMTDPGEQDVTSHDVPALEIWPRGADGQRESWACSPIEEVRRNLATTGLPEDRIRFVEGKVEDTIPDTVPDRIALLRLDTDFFSSTYHEMLHLFPRLSVGGILIVDDYGVWRGSRKAVDQYIAENDLKILLTRLDQGARLAIKLE